MQERASVPPTVARWDASIQPVVLGASFDDVRSPRDGAARDTSPRRGEVDLLARSQRNLSKREELRGNRLMAAPGRGRAIAYDKRPANPGREAQRGREACRGGFETRPCATGSPRENCPSSA